MNLNRPIKNLFGKETAMSFPSRQQAEEAMGDDGQINSDKLPRETVRNVLLNCLAQYPIKDKKEVFYVQTIANVLLEEGEVELKEKFKNFLIDVVYEMTFNNIDGKGGKGIYLSWVISQVLEELGIKNNEE